MIRDGRRTEHDLGPVSPAGTGSHRGSLVRGEETTERIRFATDEEKAKALAKREAAAEAKLNDVEFIGSEAGQRWLARRNAQLSAWRAKR